MGWIERKIEEHNERLDPYVESDEYWTVKTWLASLFVFVVLLSMPIVIIGACVQNVVAIIVGVVAMVVSIAWHFWHLLYW